MLYCFTCTSKTEEEAVRNAVKKTYLNHKHPKRTLGSSPPSIETMAKKVLGYVLVTQQNLGLARIKREFLPFAIRAYGEFASEIESGTRLRTTPQV